MAVIYPERESKSIELKSLLPNFSQLIKTCVAFANGVGGQLIIGVDDKTRQVIGVDEATQNRIYDEFPNSIYDATSPSLLVEVYEQNFDGVNVLVIDVPASIKKPVFIKSEGVPKGIYLRAGSSTRRASEDSVEELMRENKRIYFDEEPALPEVSVLSSELLQSIFGKINPTQLVGEKVFAAMSAHSKTYHPTIAGLLTFCQSPQKYLPEALIQCTQFRGTEGRDIIQTQEISGNLETQIAQSFQLIKSWLLRDYQLVGATLRGTTIVPEVALREAIANAVLHRKYWLPGSVKIALYDDRLEIFSPGNFPGIIDVNDLGDGTTYLRNPHLVRIARRFGLIEKLGTGIKLIFESCQKAGLKKPEFIEGADSVKIIFYLLPEKDNFLAEEERLMALFNMREAVTLKEMQHYLQVSRNTATRRLNQLLESGKIRRLGKGPAVRYVRVEPPRQ